MKQRHRKDAIETRRPGWDAVVLVCRDCRKRGSGPKGFELKPTLHESRRAFKRSALRARVVAASCLGLCPKRAFAVAVVGGAAGSVIAAVQTLEQLGPTLSALAEAAGPKRG